MKLHLVFSPRLKTASAAESSCYPWGFPCSPRQNETPFPGDSLTLYSDLYQNSPGHKIQSFSRLIPHPSAPVGQNCVLLIFITWVLHRVTHNGYLLNIVWINRWINSPPIRGATPLACPQSFLGRSSVMKGALSAGNSRMGKKGEGFLSAQISQTSWDPRCGRCHSKQCVLPEFPLCLMISHSFLLCSYKLYHSLPQLAQEW